VAPPRRRRRAPSALAVVGALLLAGAVGVGGYFAGRGSGSSSEGNANANVVLSADGIAKAPAFTASQLAAEPKDGWITN
jgi:hypothetical protein